MAETMQAGGKGVMCVGCKKLSADAIFVKGESESGWMCMSCYNRFVDNDS